MAESQVEWAERYYSRQVDRVVQGLRDLAERVEQEGRAKPRRRDGKPEYVAAATRVVHTLTWGVANLPLETLLTNANDADQMSRNP